MNYNDVMTYDGLTNREIPDSVNENTINRLDGMARMSG